VIGIIVTLSGAAGDDAWLAGQDEKPADRVKTRFLSNNNPLPPAVDRPATGGTFPAHGFFLLSRGLSPLGYLLGNVLKQQMPDGR
jgi:hypothetical protein